MAKWQLREPYFQGAKTYTIDTGNGEKITIEVDAKGVFELDEPPKFPLGIFAKSPD